MIPVKDLKTKDLEGSPVISVIVPVYNGERYINNCIDSLLDQNFTSFEVICVDDGSVDNSFKILDCRASLDNRIKVICQTNMGVTKARKNGVEHAAGRYICFVDCDDTLFPDSLKVLFDAAVVNDADIVCANSTYAYRIKFNSLLKPIEYIAALLEQKVDLVVWAKLYKRHVLTDWAFDIPSHIKFAEDYIMNVRVGFNSERISFIRDIVYNYSEYNTGSVTSTFRINSRYMQEISESILCEIRKNNAENILRNSMSFCLKYMIWLLIRNNTLDMKNEWVNNTLKEIRPIFSFRERLYFMMRKQGFFPILQKIRCALNRDLGNNK